MRKKNKLLTFLLILVIIFTLVYIVENVMLKSINNNINYAHDNIPNKLIEIDSINEQINLTKINIENKKSEINSTNEQYYLIVEQFYNSSYELQQLKSGNKYRLHDPIFKEVEEFINKDNSDNSLKLIENAKNQGIRCAYVLVYIGDAMYTLVGFDTSDKGMVYFEPVSDYQVVPEIGKFYSSCFVGTSNFPSFDLITDILVIW